MSISIQVLTEAPGGYVEMTASEVIGTDRCRTTDDVRVRFRNGDFVIVSQETARSLGQLGMIAPVLRA
jgi:hypothetical protein